MKLGIIGTGMIAKVMAKTVGQMKDMECYAVASRNLERAEKFATEQFFKKAYGSKGYILAKNINNITEIEVYGMNRELINSYQVPLQITGYEYEVMASRRAILQNKLECEEMTHEETLILMKQMDQLRNDGGMKYPFE